MEKQNNTTGNVINFDSHFDTYVRPWRIAVNKILEYYVNSFYYKNFGKARQAAFLSFFDPVLKEPFATVLVGVGMERQGVDFISECRDLSKEKAIRTFLSGNDFSAYDRDLSQKKYGGGIKIAENMYMGMSGLVEPSDTAVPLLARSHVWQDAPSTLAIKDQQDLCELREADARIHEVYSSIAMVNS